MRGTMRFGYDGDGGLGERLLAAVLRGQKTATSSLLVEFADGEPLPRAGEVKTLVDADGRARGTVETTRVEVVALDAVGDAIAHAEGEGFADAAAWRAAHVDFWTGAAELIRAAANDPGWRLRPDEAVVVEWFRLLPP